MIEIANLVTAGAVVSRDECLIARLHLEGRRLFEAAAILTVGLEREVSVVRRYVRREETVTASGEDIIAVPLQLLH